jgi:hypothetical protein
MALNLEAAVSETATNMDEGVQKMKDQVTKTTKKVNAKIRKGIKTVKTVATSPRTKAVIGNVLDKAAYSRDAVLIPTGGGLLATGTVLNVAGIAATKAGAAILAQAKTKAVATVGQTIKDGLKDVDPIGMLVGMAKTFTGSKS